MMVSGLHSLFTMELSNITVIFSQLWGNKGGNTGTEQESKGAAVRKNAEIKRNTEGSQKKKQQQTLFLSHFEPHVLI